MTRFLLAVAFGLFVLSTGPGNSFADDRGHWDHRRDWRSHGRPHATPQRFHAGRSDWWHQGRWRHGYHDGHRGWWWVIGSSWYLYPTPVYPYPPQVAIAPVLVPVQPQVSVAPYCREFQGDAIIDGTNQRFYGTACLQPDGAWHIVP